jgi:AcrR family transcriptional regulator
MQAGDLAPSLRAVAIAAARARFLRWGYAGTSISMIAEDLGVTKAALYYHFPDKEALFLAVFDEYLEGVAADLAGLSPLFSGAPGSSAHAAFSALAKVFLSRGEASVRMDRLAFQESPRLGEAGRLELGQRYHRDLVRPLGECFGLAEKALWVRPAIEGEPARVWLFMGLLSAFFAPGHAARTAGDTGMVTVDRDAAAFALALLGGIGNR